MQMCMTASRHGWELARVTKSACEHTCYYRLATGRFRAYDTLLMEAGAPQHIQRAIACKNALNLALAGTVKA